MTPTRFVPHAWFPPMKGLRVLGLASGGGQQMPIFSLLGARTTVFDYSPKQLESEKMVAEREGYEIEIMRGDMTQPLPFPDQTFDLIFHPVSNCYIENVRPVFQECFRVLKQGGILLAGLDTGINFVFNDEETALAHVLPFNPLKDDVVMRECMESDAGVQFSHTLEEQLGGQLEAGLCLTDLFEDFNSTGNLAAHRVPAFLATRSVRP